MEVSDFVVRSGSISAETLLQTAAERFLIAHPQAEANVEVASDAWIDADPALLQRVLTNLLENAAKYGVASDASGARVVLSAESDAQTTRLSVRDHGPGVALDETERVFEPFFRGDRSRSDSNGVGLGLALSRRIIDAHDGRLYVEHASPGARFVIELPR